MTVVEYESKKEEIHMQIEEYRQKMEAYLKQQQLQQQPFNF